MAGIKRAFVHCQRAAVLVRNAGRTPNLPQARKFAPLFSSEYGNPTAGLSLRFSTESEVGSSNPTGHILDENKRRFLNRLLYRSKQRGLLELDLVLGKWVEENIQSLDDTHIKALVEVLNLENPDLWKWLTAQEPAPEAVIKNPVFSALHEKVLKKLNAYASPETRAAPGQPWVRGWDDKRGLGGPIAGNQ